jgi:hypothetical protein
MCDTACPERHPRSRPCWAGLYASALPQLATLAIVEAAGPSNAVRVLARCVLTVGTFVAMAWWLRVSGATLDLQEWCDCASQTITVRVIESHRPMPLPRVEPPAPADDEELAHV